MKKNALLLWAALTVTITGCKSAQTNYAGHYWYGGPPMPVNGLTVLTNEGYAVCYSELTETPLWACYRLFSTTNETPPRPSMRFKTDNRTAEPRPTHDDYTNTGYDRGHLAPSAAMGKCYGEDAQKGTFIMSNVMPQKPGLNRGPWKNLEAQVLKGWAQKYTNVWVICGPIYTTSATNIGGNVSVPLMCFKVILRETSGNPSVVAYVMPQNVEQSEDWDAWQTTVDMVEALTHFDLFWGLPEKMQADFESKKESW